MTDIKYCVANRTNARPTGHTLRRFNRHLLAGAVFAVTVLGAQAPLHAEDWIAGTGDWFNGANWSNGVVPDVQIDNDLYLAARIANGGEATLSSGDAVANQLTVGEGRDGDGGTLTVTGGNLHTGWGRIMEDGVMSLSGRGTEWSLRNPGPLPTNAKISVDGSLSVFGGAKVINVGSINVGGAAGYTSSILLSGAGTAMTSNVGMYVGSSGTGLLTVEDHAILQVSRLEIGTFDGGRGTVVATGNGTSLIVNDLVVGDRGAEDDRTVATLTIADGAQVTVSDEALITRDNSYGAWTSGTINIGAAEGESATAAGTLNADNGVYFGNGDANLVFNHTETDYDFSHVMTNSDEATASASIRQVAGVTELSGNSGGFTGSTEATGGTLLVTGNLGGVLSASKAGTIGGTGIVGSTTIGDGGTLAPGMRNAIGSLTVNGDLTFESGSTYAVDLTGAASDTVTVSGAATLSGGTVTVRSLDDSTSYQQSQTYTILSAGTLDGSFTETISPSAFLDVTTTYEGDDAKITVALIGSGEGDGGDNGGGDNGGGDNGGGDNGGGSGVFTWAADTPNQYAVAQALDSLDQSGQSLELYNDMLMLGLDDARETYEQLGGLDYAAGQSAMMQNSLSVGRMINNRLRSASGGAAAPSVPALGYAEESDVAAKGAFPDSATDGFDEGRFTAWGSGFGTWGEIDGTNGSADADIGSGGFIGGADMMVNDMWRVGVAAGYSRSTFDVDQSTGKSDNYTLATYADMEWNALAVRGGLGYTFHSAEADRKITALDQTLKGEYDANSFNAFGELAYRADLGPASVEPFANLAFVHLKTDSFTETGGTAALRVDGQTMSTTFTTIGLRAATDFDFGGVPTVARGSLGWMHAFGDVDTQTTARFATGNDFTVFGTPLDENTALVEAGLDFAVTESATLGVSYSGQFGENATDQGLNANLRVRF